jgi:RNA polymerase sigma factor (sigma-70 family)
MDDTQQLVEAASRGDEIAVEELLGRYLPALRAFIRLRAGKLLRDKESASDLAQSVCREVLQHIDRFQFGGEIGFKRWLYATAVRKIARRQEYYLAARRDARRDLAGPGGDSERPDDLLACYGTFCTPSQQAIANEELERIEAAFQKLPDDQRDVICYARILGLPHRETAELMGRSEAAVRTLLSRALALLAEILDPG